MQRSALYRRITAFQASYPDIHFDVLYIPDIDLRANFEAAMAEKAGPTILIAPAEWGPDLYNNDWVIDFSDKVEVDLPATLNQAAVSLGKVNDAWINMPLHLHGVVLYRNMSLIPNAPGSFDSMVSLARTATEAGNIGAILERSFYFSGGHLFGLGGSLMTPEGDPDFNKNDYKQSLQWLELLKSMETIGATEYLSDNDARLFKEKRVGFIIDSTKGLYLFAGDVEPLNLAIDPWPVYKNGNLSGFIQGESVYLTRKSLQEDFDVSWMFVEWMLSAESQATLAGVGLIPSIKPAVIESNNQRISDPFIAQAMNAMEDGVAYPTAPEMEVYLPHLDILLQRVLMQDVDAKVALESAYNSILEELITFRTMQATSP
jgi:ABC-type glycerol-3-phosphate transport system substrate-binding protein